MRLPKRFLALGAIAAVGLVFAAAPGNSRTGIASSHREAPFISKDPDADNTDVYAFVSPDKPDTVTLIANYIPFELPSGGPNFNEFANDVLYAIHVDNNGDGDEDITYEFKFETRIRNRNTFLYNTGPITSLDDSDWNLPQTYSVTRVDKNGRTRLGSNLPTPPVNVGVRSTPNYESLAAAAVRTVGDTKVFAGQRDDPFFVDLGSIFDLLGLRPFNGAHTIPQPAAPGVDNVAGFNLHAIALQIPIKSLTRDGVMPTGPDDPRAVIGVYASASRQRVRVLTETGVDIDSGSWVQVSRLANPLVNEVVIPLGKKDFWNRQPPKNEELFLRHFQNPELAGLVNALYPVLPDAPTRNRDDLVAVFLTGIKGLNFTGDNKAELLRLNMAIPPTAQPKRLGALEGDLAGFPNGRRLTDDAVDIEVRAVACGYGPILNQLLGLCNLSPNNTLGDGVDANDQPFLKVFPYLATPTSGYEGLP
jgi:hypothetical protein